MFKVIIFYIIFLSCLRASNLEFEKIDWNKIIDPLIRVETGSTEIFKNKEDFKKSLFFPLNNTLVRINAKNCLAADTFGSTINWKLSKVYEDWLLENIIPSPAISDPIIFNFIDILNSFKLTLPKDYFLSIDKPEKALDTTLSENGIKKFMSYYGELKSIHTYVFMSDEDFNNQLDSILDDAHSKSVAIILQMDKNHRHSSGIFIKKNNENLDVFIFDSIGIDLPAKGCGARMLNQNYSELEKILLTLKTKKVNVMLTPINTVFALQNDWYSCFCATIMFFEAILSNEYKIFSKEETDYTAIYGAEYKYLKSRYAISYLPLLAGVQNELALLLMTDCLDNFDELFPQIALAQANWHRLFSLERKATKNVFWQAGYVALLNWFNNRVNPSERFSPFSFPNLTKLALTKQYEDQGNSELQEKILSLLRHYLD